MKSVSRLSSMGLTGQLTRALLVVEFPPKRSSNPLARLSVRVSGIGHVGRQLRELQSTMKRWSELLKVLD